MRIFKIEPHESRVSRQGYLEARITTQENRLRLLQGTICQPPKRIEAGKYPGGKVVRGGDGSGGGGGSRDGRLQVEQ